MDQWYVARGKVKKGPFTSAQLRALAQKGQLRATDMLARDDSQKWVPAGKYPQLFPASAASEAIVAPPVEPFMATPPADLHISTNPRPAWPVRPLWICMGGGAIGVGLLVIVSVLVLGGRTSSDPSRKQEPLVKHTTPPEQPIPKKEELPDKNHEPEVKPEVAPEAAPVPPPAAREDIELPPVGPTPFAAPDPVMAKFKRARAAYLDARAEARLNIRLVVGPAFEEIEKGNLDAAAKAKAKQDLIADQRNYFRAGMAPTHPVVKKAVQDYTRFIETATRTYGEAAEAALVAYEKQGMTDAAKLRPLLAGRLCARHADLIGAWVRPVEDGKHETWVIDFDETTGELQAAGIVLGNNTTAAIFTGEKFEFKDGALTFSAVQLDPSNGRPWAKGVPVTMTTQNGTLRFEMRDRITGSDFDPKKGVVVWVKKTVVGDMHRSMEFGTTQDGGSDFVHLVRYLKKAGITGLEHKPQRTIETLDIADANSAWRRLALLASSGYLRRHEDLITHEQLYLPYRSSHLDFENRNSRFTADLLRQYETLADSPHPYLKQAAVQAFLLCRNRLRLAQANEYYGNTAASSIREFKQNVFVPAMEYVMSRERDRQTALREYPGGFVYDDGPLSKESQEKLAEFMKGVGNLQADVQERGKVSNLLAYADMAEVDRTVGFWQKYLLPLAKRCAGPRSNQPLISVIGGWRNRAYPAPDKRLSVFGLQNVGDQDLTHAVVEIRAENEWGEKVVHYCYLPYLDSGETVSLLPHPRWDSRGLDYANTIKATWSVWADQGTETDRHVTLTSPAPNPNAADGHKDHLRFDMPNQAEAEAMGVLMQRTTELPANAAAQRVLLREATRPGIGYVFRLPEEDKPGRTFVLRFRAGPEVEIVDAKSNAPFQAKLPVWKGQLDGQGGPHIYFRTEGNWEESGWAFSLGLDDRPMIYCPGAGNGGAPFAAREIPLFLVMTP